MKTVEQRNDTLDAVKHRITLAGGDFEGMYAVAMRALAKEEGRKPRLPKVTAPDEICIEVRASEMRGVIIKNEGITRKELMAALKIDRHEFTHRRKKLEQLHAVHAITERKRGLVQGMRLFSEKKHLRKWMIENGYEAPPRYTLTSG